VAYHGRTLLDLIPADVVSSVVVAAAAEALTRGRGSSLGLDAQECGDCEGMDVDDASAAAASASGGGGYDTAAGGGSGNGVLMITNGLQETVQGNGYANGEATAEEQRQQQQQVTEQQQQQQQEEVGGKRVMEQQKKGEQQQQPLQGADLELIIHPLDEHASSSYKQQQQHQHRDGTQGPVLGLHQQSQLPRSSIAVSSPKEGGLPEVVIRQQQQGWEQQQQGWEQQQQMCTVYHAASSSTHPFPTHHALGIMHQFYTHNTAPVHLPLPWPTRAPRVLEGHKPRWWLVRFGKAVAWGKLQVLCLVLQLSGRGRQAGALRKGFTAWCIQNSARYNRSLIFSVANVRWVGERVRGRGAGGMGYGVQCEEVGSKMSGRVLHDCIEPLQ
jgi:hypothetical protein